MPLRNAIRKVRPRPIIPHAIPTQPNPASTQNPQNSNDQTSNHETHSRELHAKLPSRRGQAPKKSRTQFDWMKSQQSPKTLQFQRSKFNIRNSLRGITCEIECGLSDAASEGWTQHLWAAGHAAVPLGGGPGLASSRRAQPRTATRRRRREGRRRDRRGPWAAAGPGQATHRHPDRLEAAAWPAGPGRASRRRTQPHTATGRRRRGGRRRNRRARAGFEARRRTK